MYILIILLAFILYLVAITVISTLLDISIRIATKQKLGLGKLFLPSTLILVLWSIVGLQLYKAISTTCQIDILSQLMNYFMKIPVVPFNISTTFGFFGIAIFITVIIQTALIYIVNFNVSKPLIILKNNLFSKVTKKDIVVKKDENENENENDEPKKKVYVDVLSCIFSSIVIFLLIIAFIFIFTILAKNIAAKLIPILLK